MALTKVTKHIIHGSLLIQFKHADLSDLSTSSNTQTFQTVGGLTMTPQYADSILETTVSGSLRDNSDSSSTNQEMQVALYVNGTQEYVKSELLSTGFAGESYTQHGGRNDRLAGNRRHSHMRQMRMSVGFVHSMRPGTTNAQTHQLRIRHIDNNSRNMEFREGFMILKEISIGIDSLSGSV
jgi:hypothetical protein